MPMVKTEKGRDALATRGTLTPRERQLLILADGQRSADELAHMLGEPFDQTAASLMERGYLMRMTPMTRLVASFSDTGTISFPLTEAPPEQTPDAAPAPSVRRARRSLAASKMYIVSLLQMLRDAEAASLAVSLHTSESLEDLTHWTLSSLMFIHERSGETYAANVALRLLETYPEEALRPLCDSLVAYGLSGLALPALAQLQELDQIEVV